MLFQSFQLFFWSLYILIAEELGFTITKNYQENEESSLLLLHVLFRHGNRTANGPEELYPKDPYVNETYFPFGLGQLTNAGKVKQYNIGRRLRARYNHFLGPYYYPEIVESLSTDYNRTKMSLQLVHAGLFPPFGETVWDGNLPWQPIPYNYHPAAEDKILLGVTCPYYLKLYEEHTRTLKAEFALYKDVFQYISNNTGLKVERFLDVYNLYFGLATEEEWGFELPQWTKKVWPKTIINLAIKEYFVSTATKDLNRMASGYFLQKVVQDTFSKIDNSESQKKIYLYSAHENNIAELLILLNVFNPVHIPDYGSHVIFEVHYIDGVYGIKIYYENYTESKPKLLKLPNCGTFCDITTFYSLIKEYLPSEKLCTYHKET